MIHRSLACCLLLAASLGATDWTKVPKLPHKLVKDWAQLPRGWNFGETASVAVDAQDNVWVFNRGPHPVIQFDRSGRFLRAWEEVPHVSAHGVAVGPDGAVWLVDVAAHRVMKFSPEGRLQMVIGAPGGNPGDNDTPYAFNRPTHLAFKPNGDFYVSDGYINTRVVLFSKAGKQLRQWGSKGSGDGQFNLVHDVTIDKNGRVYVADRDNSRVQVFDADGKFLAKWTDVGQPWGLYYVEKEDAIYMADGIANRIVKLSLDGSVLGQLGEFGKAPGQLDYPHHLAVDSDGSIYVAEIKNWRVQKFAK
ncbi:MAG: peptidyl-alpha-hydroxyglycine alpha-amidating lyase family protein [Bryobacterales bacterium]